MYVTINVEFVDESGRPCSCPSPLAPDTVAFKTTAPADPSDGTPASPATCTVVHAPAVSACPLTIRPEVTTNCPPVPDVDACAGAAATNIEVSIAPSTATTASTATQSSRNRPDNNDT
ncbi:hypothetical protein [Curtobacterium sp. 458]|uniref:hypothetical protein n=1 Tax=Curtobacterium sp. 458 TaxID=3050069 RepID=UPI0025B2EAB9|nr:hypothetical protein [Curtobacterium sp. 458]WJY00394.1 hypothetical protein QPJ90_01565 [Curtobacterium sp. 458]